MNFNFSKLVTMAFVAAVSISGLGLTLESAQAKITRSCGVSLGVYVRDGNSNNAYGLGDILGQGSCKNKMSANTCRQIARSQINQCLAEFWKYRNVNMIPAKCRNLVGGSSRPGARLTYQGVMPIAKPKMLMARAARVVCCQLRRGAASVEVQIAGRIFGDKKGREI